VTGVSWHIVLGFSSLLSDEFSDGDWYWWDGMWM
jgi:hypothetical protein